MPHRQPRLLLCRSVILPTIAIAICVCVAVQPLLARLLTAATLWLEA